MPENVPHEPISGLAITPMVQPNDEPLPLTMTLGAGWTSVEIARGVLVHFQFNQAAFVIPQFTDTAPATDPSQYPGGQTQQLECFNCKYLHFKAVGTIGDGTGTLFRFQLITTAPTTNVLT